MEWRAFAVYGHGVSTQADRTRQNDRRRTRHASTSRRGRARRSPFALLGGIAIAIVVAAAALGATAYVTTPHLEAIAPGVAERDASPELSARVTHAGAVRGSDVTVWIDGYRMPDANVSARGTRIIVRPGTLDDGRHRITVRATGLGWLDRSARTSWRFSIDTKVPRIHLLTQPDARSGRLAFAARNPELSLQTEPRAHVTFRAGSRITTVTAPSNGLTTTSVRLQEGLQTLRIESRDAAGNVKRRSVPTVVDSLAPLARMSAPRTLATPDWTGSAQASDASAVTTRFLIDGRGGETVTKYRSGRQSWTIGTGAPLSEGRHLLEFLATDSVGHVTRIAQRVLVDSTEELGANALGTGARGADVRELQQALELKGLFDPGSRTGKREWQRRVYGAETAAAVRSYQSRHGLTADGIAGPDTVAAMTLRIHISRAANTLTLFRLDRIVRTFHVATGSPTYPTPAGRFRISNMAMNPTWTPPDSPWADGAKPIPPGPDNPLGTRWMGLNTPNVGIHGTNNPASIGYSVSHGCIRMAIPDVEALYDLVTVGTPVIIT